MIPNLQVKWRKDIDAVQLALADLMLQRRWMEERIVRMFRDNKRLQRSGMPFFRVLLEWYGSHVLMAVRRQSDDDDNVVSLRRVLEQMTKNPEALKGLSRVRGDLSVSEVAEDIESLKRVSKKLVTLVDKEVAHAQRGGAKFDDGVRPGTKELNTCIDEYAEIANKYLWTLTGAVTLSPLPIETDEVSGAFRTPWIPDCVLCTHSAIYHNGRVCNGWIDAYKRAQAAGRRPLPSTCDCALTEAQVYAQTEVEAAGE